MLTQNHKKLKQQFFPRYKMIRQIAEGGFSTVELVEDSETGKKFALKRILCHSIEDQNVALQVGSYPTGSVDVFWDVAEQIHPTLFAQWFNF